MALVAFLLLLPVSCGKPGGGSGNPVDPPEQETGPTVRIASFNIRFATDSDTGVRAWSARKEACTKVVQQYNFGVWGLQEVLSSQQTDLKALLPQYDFYFVGRDDGTAGEAVGIAWLKSKYECLDKGRFWLSPTPDVPSGSEAWGGISRHRVAVWARFREMSSGKNFYIFSTHLEVGEDYTDVRLKSAELVVARENQLNISGLPVFIVGDMNPIAPTEKAMLPQAGMLLTLETGIRFLTDYLEGDQYFKTAYPEHNLVRARTQLRLVADMEAHWDEMEAIVREVARSVHPEH